MSQYGQFKVRVISDGYDEVGIRSITLAQCWVPSRSDLSPMDLLNERPFPPSMDPLLLRPPIGTTQKDGFYETSWTFKGSAADRAEFPLQTRDISKLGSFKAKWGEFSLLLHPLWPDLQKNWGAVVNTETGRITWPQTKPSTASGAVKSAGSNEYNRLYGRQTFFYLTGGTYSFKYASEDLMPSLFSNVGQILQSGSLPGKAPNFPDQEKRNWMVMTPEYEPIGNRFSITELFDLSDVGGWPEEIYPVRMSA